MHRAFIRNGKLAMSKPASDRFQRWKAAHEGDEIAIDLFKPERSSSQNRYYWMYLEVIASETGDNASDLHEFFKRKLLPPVFKTVRGEELRLPASTRKLEKAQFGEYLDKICAMTGVALPDPEAAGYIDERKPPKETYQPSPAEMEIGEGPTF